MKCPVFTSAGVTGNVETRLAPSIFTLPYSQGGICLVNRHENSSLHLPRSIYLQKHIGSCALLSDDDVLHLCYMQNKILRAAYDPTLQRLWADWAVDELNGHWHLVEVSNELQRWRTRASHVQS